MVSLVCRSIQFNLTRFVARLQQAIVRSSEMMTAVETRTLSILIFIVSLLGEHCDFDHLRVQRPGEHNID
jgi:hypothetical protein